MCTAANQLDIRTAFAALGIQPVHAGTRIVNWKRAVSLFRDWRCVVAGPFTNKYWQSHGSSPEALAENEHVLSLCFLCQHMAKNGPCEHSYAALLLTKRTFKVPVARGRGRPNKSDVANTSSPVATSLLLPGSLMRTTAAVAEKEADRLISSPKQLSTEDHALLTALQSCGLAHRFEAMQSQGLTLALVPKLSFSDFNNFFGVTIGQTQKLLDHVANASLAAATPAAKPSAGCVTPAPRSKRKSSSSSSSESDSSVGLTRPSLVANAKRKAHRQRIETIGEPIWADDAQMQTSIPESLPPANPPQCLPEDEPPASQGDVFPASQVQDLFQASQEDSLFQASQDADHAISSAKGWHKVHSSPKEILDRLAPPLVTIRLNHNDHRFACTFNYDSPEFAGDLKSKYFSKGFNETVTWMAALQEVHQHAWAKWSFDMARAPLADNQEEQLPGILDQELVDELSIHIHKLPPKKKYQAMSKGASSSSSSK